MFDKHMKTIEYIRNGIATFYSAAAFKFGFAVRPREVMWPVTWRCNLACNYCETGKADTGELESGELSFADAQKVISRLREAGVRSVILLGGEPLLYKEIFNVISCCKEQGLAVRLISNGTLITEDVARRLASTGIDHITLSLDSPDAVQDELRNCRGCFDRIDAAIRHLVNFRERGGYDLNLSCVITARNIGNLEAFFAYAEQAGVDTVTLHPMYPHQTRNREIAARYRIDAHALPVLDRDIRRLLKRYAHLNRHSAFFNGNIVRYCRDLQVKGASCFAGGPVLSMFPDGTISPCLYLREKKCGTLRTAALAQITGSEPYRALVRRIREGGCPGCWCVGVHYYNLFFKPVEMLRYLVMLRSSRRRRGSQQPSNARR